MTHVAKIVEIVGSSDKSQENAAQVNDDEVKEIMKKYNTTHIISSKVNVYQNVRCGPAHAS